MIFQKINNNFFSYLKDKTQLVLLGIDSLQSRVYFPMTIELFRKFVYLWLLGTLLLFLPAAPQLWGPYSYSYPKTNLDSTYFDRIFDLLSFPQIAPYYPYFIGAQIILLLFGLWQIFPRIAGIGICYLNFILDHKAWATMHGGNDIIQVMLLFLMMMKTTATSPPSLLPSLEKPSWLGRANILLTNFAFFAARLQLCLIYLDSAVAKLQGELWTSGIAMYYILRTQEYSHPWVINFVAQNNFFSNLFVVAGTYFTVFFQLSFPFLVWVKRVRPLVFIAGFVMHLSISLVMGLFDFGIAMMICYLLFYPEEKSLALFSRYHRFKENCLLGIKKIKEIH